MTDLLLIEAPQTSVVEEKMDVPPLGLAYIASVVEKGGFSVEILDLNLGKENLSARIKEASLVGISSYTHNYPITLQRTLGKKWSLEVPTQLHFTGMSLKMVLTMWLEAKANIQF
jgi:hypothetical protein